jgi:SAM-dependent methyltransferase
MTYRRFIWQSLNTIQEVTENFYTERNNLCLLFYTDCIIIFSQENHKMNSKDLGEKYNLISDWWTEEQSKNPEYGMYYIRKAMGFAKRKSKFLDLGCGSTCRVIDEALKNEFEVTGIDISSKMIELAKERHPNIDLVNIDFLEWETKDQFDLIIAWDSIFHAPIHLQKKITIKMCQMLSPEGILLFTCGTYAGEASGTMQNVLFKYGSIGFRGYLDVIENMNCKIILIEEDQYPSGHLVVMCQKQ